ncbi:MAG: flagellar assembly peptidoglycan hydrolase FlgJ, partial [Gammaproteobacteria bacterium]|nr:flagellar assembly peptidoglycan hydrolase FlgJ [Gammaproteobacteria bacterium]
METFGAQIYNDFQGLANLKAKSVHQSEDSVDEVARQFESLFLQMMLKSMRDASTSFGDSLMDSDHSIFYREMFDQQLSLDLSGSGGVGLADVIKRQLGGGDGEGAAINPVKDIADYRRQAAVLAQQRSEVEAPPRVDVKGSVDRVSDVAASTPEGDPRQWSKSEFVENLWPMAQEAAQLLGLKPQALIAQAALETGWGAHLMKFSSGKLTNNLFGIKADQRWSGAKLSVSSMEYEQNQAVNRRSYFRAYDSLADSFTDYAAFIQGNPRYTSALGTGTEV